MSDKQIDPKNIEELGRISEPDLAQYNPLQEKIDYLETRIKVLEAICQEINPYEPLSDDLKLRLRDFNIIALDDPFKVTNALLTLLEDSIDELHILKPFDPESSEVKEIL